MRHMALILAASAGAGFGLCSMSKDGEKDHGGGGGHSKAHPGAGTGAQHGNKEPLKSTSGLDVNGEMRLGDRYTLAVNGDGLVIRQSNSGREVDVSESEFEGLIEREYFRDPGN